MKKYVLLSVIILAAIAVQSQVGFYSYPVRFGFKVDPVFINNLSPKENNPTRDASKMGVNYGLMAGVMFRDGRSSFATGLEVVHTGGKLNYTQNGLFGAGNYNLKLQYLQVPLSIKLKTNFINGLRWWGQFGTYAGALIGSRLDFVPASGNTLASQSNLSVIKSMNGLNIGLLAGLGGEYRIAERTDLLFGLGLENGFTDVTANKKLFSNSNRWNDGKVALNRWAIRLGVFF